MSEDTVETYGITYVPTSGPLAGVRIALMRHYGFTMLFKKREQAEKYVAKVFNVYRRSLSVETDAGTFCMSLVRDTVEFFSGRLEISSGNFILKDPRKKRYDQLYQHLLNARACDIRDATDRARRVNGTALVFSDRK